jgi:hypothetical protein
MERLYKNKRRKRKRKIKTINPEISRLIKKKLNNLLIIQNFIIVKIYHQTKKQNMLMHKIIL